MRFIGFSHGVTYKLHDTYSQENINLFKDCGCNAIEIKCHSIEEVNKLDSVLDYIKDFKYVSLHLPCSYVYKDDEETRSVLKKMEDFYIKSKAKLAVLHPDLVENWNVFDDFPSVNWAIENMDNEQESFRSVEELREFFKEHDNWSFVLDLGHCNANDKTMVLAEKMIDEFRDRIKEIHLSGYKLFHEALHETKQSEIIKPCKYLDVPIIIESVIKKAYGEDGVKKEFDYVLENLK